MAKANGIIISYRRLSVMAAWQWRSESLMASQWLWQYQRNGNNQCEIMAGAIG
jgi:hypothetical protein